MLGQQTLVLREEHTPSSHLVPDLISHLIHLPHAVSPYLSRAVLERHILHFIIKRLLLEIFYEGAPRRTLPRLRNRGLAAACRPCCQPHGCCFRVEAPLPRGPTDTKRSSVVTPKITEFIVTFKSPLGPGHISTR